MMDKKPIDEVLTAVKKDIDWYNQKYKVATITMLLDMRAHLTTLLYTLAEYVGETKEHALSAETARKFEFATHRKECLAADMSIAKSDSEAFIKTKPLQDEADKYDGWYTKLKILLDAAGKVDDAIMQRVSILKKEKERENA